MLLTLAALRAASSCGAGAWGGSEGPCPRMECKVGSRSAWFEALGALVFQEGLRIGVLITVFPVPLIDLSYH